MRELIRRNRDEMQDRRRARAEVEHNPLGTRTYTLAVRDEEENSDDEEAGIQRGGIEDSNDEEAGIQRGGIKEEVDHDDYLQESASETDTDAVPKIAPKKTGECEEEASVSSKNTVAIEPAATAEKRDAEEIEINIVKTHESGAYDDVGKITVKVDVHAARGDGVYQEDEAAPAPVKRKKTGTKTRKKSKTVSGGDKKAAVDIPGVKPSDQASNTGSRSQRMRADRGGKKKAAVDIPDVKPSDQASAIGRSQKMKADAVNKKKAAVDIPGVKPSDQGSSTGKSQTMKADSGDKKKAAVDIPGVKPSDQAGGLWARWITWTEVCGFSLVSLAPLWPGSRRNLPLEKGGAMLVKKWNSNPYSSG